MGTICPCQHPVWHCGGTYKQPVQQAPKAEPQARAPLPLPSPALKNLRVLATCWRLPQMLWCQIMSKSPETHKQPIIVLCPDPLRTAQRSPVRMPALIVPLRVCTGCRTLRHYSVPQHAHTLARTCLTPCCMLHEHMAGILFSRKTVFTALAPV